MRCFHIGGRALKTAPAVTFSIVTAQELVMKRVTLAASHSSKRRSLLVAGMEVIKSCFETEERWRNKTDQHKTERGERIEN